MPMITPVEGPAFAIPMPLNHEGHGPECDPTKVAITVYEVWDQVLNVICRCQYEGDAQLIARLINQENGL